MRTLPFRFNLILTLWIAFMNQVLAQNMQVIAFTPLESKRIPPTTLHAFLKVDTLQQHRHNLGIAFCIQVKNDSTAAITIRNPLDFMVLRLETRNQPGFNLVYPEFYRQLAHSASSSSYTYQSIRVEGVSLNGMNTPLDLNKTTALTIPANSLLEIVARIPFLLTEAATKPYTLRQTRTIPDGSYQLGIHLALVVDSRLNQAQLLRIPTLGVCYAN
jgi:hypothetical protein